MTEPHNEAEKQAEEAEVLHPDRTITIAGREVTVREFRALESMRLASKTRPIVASLREICDEQEGAPPTGDIVETMLERHGDAFFDLMAVASDQPREWIEQLGDDNFFALLTTFWEVNAGFFTRRLASALTPAMAAAPPDSEATAGPH